jgi:hypothetical protein
MQQGDSIFLDLHQEVLDIDMSQTNVRTVFESCVNLSKDLCMLPARNATNRSLRAQ